ncbi:MAG TPA: hypothetical protein PLZ43_01615 [bacterium]|nr:hypothetical protein [bacterium]
MKCFYCSIEIKSEFSENCPGCGKVLGKVCSKCGIEYESGANFCMSCGGKLDELAQKVENNEELFILEEVTVPDNPVPEPVVETSQESDDVLEIDLKVDGFEPDVLEVARPEVNVHKKKNEPKKSDIDFDSLFTELNTLELVTGESGAVIPEEKSHDIRHDSSDDSESDRDEMLINLKSEKILVKATSDYQLKPAKITENYDVSVDELIKDVVTAEFEESCVPLLRKIEKNLRICKGGIFYLRGEAGSGKSLFVNRIKTTSEKAGSEGSFNLVVTDANIFDFDFMIFISLARILMKIKSNDVGTVRKKLDKLFGDTLPESKKDCLSALICLNFAPVKTKLPKHDIEYLLSYVLYGLSRSKPVIWVVNNANTLNVRSIKFFNSLQKVLEAAPMAVILITDPDAAVLSGADINSIYDFKGFPEDKLKEEIAIILNTKKIPVELEKLLKDKAQGNMLFTLQLTEFLKDKGFIFEMKGSWRFSKLPDDFVCPSNLDDLISQRVDLLSEEVSRTLKEFTLLNLFEVPKTLFNVVSTTSPACVEELVRKGYILEAPDYLRFSSRTMLSALKKKVKIGKNERNYYRDIVTKLSSTPAEIYQLNKHWLLLSYINLGGIVDKRLNSFLFSSAVYMEKLGFFEISQRSYQTIISSFGVDDTLDDFKILPEIKNARLWRLVEPQWAKIFWEKLLNYSKIRNDYHLELLSSGELLLEKENVNLSTIAEVVKKMHIAGCYEEEVGLIDRTVELLISSGNFLDANTFAARGYKILRDIIMKYGSKDISPADFVYVLYVRCACKLAEVCIMLEDYDKASAILEEALEYAERYSVSYFKSKIQHLLGKIRFAQKDEWEEIMKEGFYNAIIGMDFSIIKSFLYFFEENNLEEKEWVAPFLEYKNWINF